MRKIVPMQLRLAPHSRHHRYTIFYIAFAFVKLPINILFVVVVLDVNVQGCPEYTCPSDQTCYRETDICNGKQECSDGYDEYGCQRKWQHLTIALSNKINKCYLL